MTDAALRVDGDLTFAVQDAGRRASGTVTATGEMITVTVDRPWVALQAVRSAELPGGRSRGRSDLAPVADALAAAGLRLAVKGPNGTLVTLGDGVASRFGRLVAGSSKVAVRPRAAVGINRAVAGLGVISLAVVVAAVATRGGRATGPSSTRRR